MNNVTRESSFIVVMVNWANGVMVPIAAGFPTQAEAEIIAAEALLTNEDAVMYVMSVSAYARTDFS